MKLLKNRYDSASGALQHSVMENDPSEQISHSDTKDFVEHVRTVHFALLITAISLVVAALNNRTNSIRQASTELAQVEAIRAYMAAGRLKHTAIQAAANDGSVDRRFSDSSDKTTLWLHVESNGEQPKDAQVEYSPLGYSRNLMDLFDDENKDQPETLSQFADRWNLLYIGNHKSFIIASGKRLARGGKETTTDVDDSKTDIVTYKEYNAEKDIRITSNPIENKASQILIYDLTRHMVKRRYQLDSVLNYPGISPNGTCIALVTDQAIDESEPREIVLWREGAVQRKIAVQNAMIAPGTRLIALNSAIDLLAIPTRSPRPFVYSIHLIDVSGRDLKDPDIQFPGKAPITFVGSSNCLLYTPLTGPGILHYGKLLKPGGVSVTGRLVDQVNVETIVSSTDGKWAAVAGRQDGDSLNNNEVVWIIDLTFASQPSLLEDMGADASVPSLAFSADGQTLVAAAVHGGSGHSTLIKWNYDGVTWRRSLNKDLPYSQIMELACSKNVSRIVFFGDNRLVQVNTADLSVLEEAPIAGEGIDALAFLGSDSEITLIPRGNNLERSESSFIEPMYNSVLSDEAAEMPDTVSLVSWFYNFSPNVRVSETRYVIPFAEWLTGADVKSLVRSVNMQSELAKLAGIKIREGTFDRSFPNLAGVTKNLERLPIHDTGEILKDEGDRSGDSVEAFGVKMPAEALRQWGAVLIIGIQLYFSRHLRFMRLNHLGGFVACRSAWIGLYDDATSRIGTLLTAALFPTAAGITLIFLNTWSAWIVGRCDWGMILIAILVVFITTFLGIRIMSELLSLSRARLGADKAFPTSNK